MMNLIEETPEALTWIEQQVKGSDDVHECILWTDNYLVGSEPIGGNDPSNLICEINDRGLPILRGHDPGCPAGQIFAAREFRSASGVRFVAGVLKYYKPEQQLSFASFGLNALSIAASPERLEPLNDEQLEIGADPREVDSNWLDDVLADAPIRVRRFTLSHNAAESVAELIRIGLPRTLLIWNPLVTAVANEAAKDLYANTKHWLLSFWRKLEKLKNPIVVVQTSYNNCEISFLFRSREVERHYRAHSELHTAAAQALSLIDSLTSKHAEPVSITYEFEESRWYPSYAVLSNGQLISDHSILIATEQLPKGMSLGLRTK